MPGSRRVPRASLPPGMRVRQAVIQIMSGSGVMVCEPGNTPPSRRRAPEFSGWTVTGRARGAPAYCYSREHLRCPAEPEKRLVTTG